MAGNVPGDLALNLRVNGHDRGAVKVVWSLDLFQEAVDGVLLLYCATKRIQTVSSLSNLWPATTHDSAADCHALVFFSILNTNSPECSRRSNRALSRISFQEGVATPRSIFEG